MSHAISLSEMVGRTSLEASDLIGEVFATAEASYDDSSHEVVVILDAHVCPEDASDPMRHLRPAWLSKGETVRVSGDVHERSDIAHDVFHSWVGKVRTSMPQES
jgi:hypothetical protein